MKRLAIVGTALLVAGCTIKAYKDGSVKVCVACVEADVQAKKKGPTVGASQSRECEEGQSDDCTG